MICTLNNSYQLYHPKNGITGKRPVDIGKLNEILTSMMFYKLIFYIRDDKLFYLLMISVMS